MAALSDNDKAALAEAVQLVMDVVNRHPLEYTTVIGAHVQAVVRGVDVVRKDFEEAR